MSDFYADMAQGVIFVVEVFEDGVWGFHTTTGTLVRARNLIRERHLSKARITEFRRHCTLPEEPEVAQSGA